MKKPRKNVLGRKEFGGLTGWKPDVNTELAVWADKISNKLDQMIHDEEFTRANNWLNNLDVPDGAWELFNDARNKLWSAMHRKGRLQRKDVVGPLIGWEKDRAGKPPNRKVHGLDGRG